MILYVRRTIVFRSTFVERGAHTLVCAKLWGTYISIDEETRAKRRLSVGRVQVCTDEPGIISQPVKVVVDGVVVMIRVAEELERGHGEEELGIACCLGESSQTQNGKARRQEHLGSQCGPGAKSSEQSKMVTESNNQAEVTSREVDRVNSAKAGKMGGLIQNSNSNWEIGASIFKMGQDNSFSSGLKVGSVGLMTSDFVLESDGESAQQVGRECRPIREDPKKIELLVDLGPLLDQNAADKGEMGLNILVPLGLNKNVEEEVEERSREGANPDYNNTERGSLDFSGEEEEEEKTANYSQSHSLARGRSLTNGRGRGRGRSSPITLLRRSTSVGRIFGSSRLGLRNARRSSSKHHRSRSRSKRRGWIGEEFRTEAGPLNNDGGLNLAKDQEQRCEREALESYKHSKRLGVAGGGLKKEIISKIKILEQGDRSKKAKIARVP